MEKISNSSRWRDGFTLIETTVAIGILGMLFAAIAFILQNVLTNIGESRVRSTALALAQTKMEVVRNLPYTQVGTIGGIPQGPIAATEMVTINTLPVTVTTSVVYVDDPFDGVVPADLVNTDYKRVRIEITWGGTYPSRVPLALVSNIVPKGIETATGGGTLFIQVFNALSQPVSNATVKIDNTAVNPQVHIQTLTNSDGLVVLPGSPACISCYQITVTKTGYSQDKTYTTTEVTNPLQPLATVIEGQVSQLSFSIDVESNLSLRSYGTGPNYPPVANVQFTLRGNKVIGYDADDNPVYKYAFSTNTGGGTVEIPALEWDTYSLDFTNSAHNLAGSNPINPLTVAPGTNQTVSLVAVPKTNTSLLLIIQNAAQELQASASTQLKNTSIAYDVTKFTTATGSADFGQTFFGSLTPGVYDLKVNLSGYQEATASMNSVGINQQTVTLNIPEPSP